MIRCRMMIAAALALTALAACSDRPPATIDTVASVPIATPAPAETASPIGTNAVDQVELIYRTTQRLASPFLPMLTPDQRLAVHAAEAAIEAGLALARRATTAAEQKAALDAVHHELPAIGIP